MAVLLYTWMKPTLILVTLLAKAEVKQNKMTNI